MNELFLSFLNFSAGLRPGYPASLGKSAVGWKDQIAQISNTTPDLLIAIYDQVLGTKRNSEDQALLDFIPGYRLIHIEEYVDYFKQLQATIQKRSTRSQRLWWPILANYSSDFICQSQDNQGGSIIKIIHDQEEPVVLHRNGENFLNTIIEFYRKGVYRVNMDEFLDYDNRMEQEIGAKMNPGVMYWSE